MIDAWSGPPPTPQQFPRREPNGIKKAVDLMLAVPAQIRESTAALLRSAGIRLTTAGMIIDSSLTVAGGLTATGDAELAGNTHIAGALDVDATTNLDGATTVGGTLDVTGETNLDGATSVGGTLDVAGAMSILGTLSLPAGIIGNAALTSPLQVDSASSSETNYATATTNQTRAATTIPVPAGFSQALVFLTATVAAINSTGSADYLYASAVIAGTASRETFGYAGPTGGSTGFSTSKAAVVTGLSGGTISVSCLVHSQNGAWAANGVNRAYVEAIAIFLR